MEDAPQSDWQRLEEQLRAQLKATEQSYRRAAREHAEVAKKYADRRDSYDGAYAIHQAAKHELVALQAYSRALKIFADLVERGHLPPPTE